MGNASMQPALVVVDIDWATDDVVSKLSQLEATCRRHHYVQQATSIDGRNRVALQVRQQPVALCFRAGVGDML